MEVTIRFPPMQSFMDYVFETYSELATVCTSKGTSVEREECVKCCSDSYYGGDIQYKCINSKKIYLIKYMAAQIKQIDLALNQVNREDICSKQEVNAISLGGGPGTEAIALMDVLGNCDTDFIMRFDNIDSEQSWKGIYEDLTQVFAKKIGNVKVKTSFTSADLKKYAKNVRAFYDIAFVSWLFSLLGSPDDIKSILDMLKGLIKEGGYIVVADRFEDKVVERIANAIEKVTDLTLKEQDRHIEWCGVIFPDELRDSFQVRLKANAVYWILQKNFSIS